MPTTRSGRNARPSPLPDGTLPRNMTKTRTPPERPKPRRRAGPKSVISNENGEEPHPLPRSSARSGPRTSSAEEEVFLSNFSRRQSIIQNKSDYTNPEADTDGVATDGDEESGKPLSFAPTPGRNSVDVTAGEKNTSVSTAQSQSDKPKGAANVCKDMSVLLASVAQSVSNIAVAPPHTTPPTPVHEAPSQHHSGDVTAGDKGTSASTAHQSDKPKDATNICKDTSASTAQSESNIAVAPRPHRSGAAKSYTHDHSDGAESSPSDSDWAADEEKRKKVARPSAVDGDGNDGGPPPSPLRLTRERKGKGRAKEFDDDDDEQYYNDDQEVNEDKSDEGPAKKGRLPLEVVLKAQELGRTTVEAAKALGKEYGKSARVILIEAGLVMKATRKESPSPPLKDDIKAWKEEQAAHYKAHPYKDPKHAALWQKIQEYWDGCVTGATEDLTSRSASSLMLHVRDDFSKAAGYWYHTHGIHISGVAIFPGHEDAGRQASGFFSGSDIMKDIINARQLDISRILDELTTILKYKDLEAAQAEGVTFSFLPRSTDVPNGTLLCNGKSARDRNRKVAPMIISEKFAEAGHPLKTSNNRWLDILNTLYIEQLCIHDWPAGVPPPGPDFDLKAVSASQLRALVVPYLRMHLGAIDAKTKKRKGKSKKSNDNRRTKGKIVEEPDMVLSIREWSEYDVEHFESQSTSMYSIPLVINTNGEVLRELQDSVKFFKDFPLPDKASTKQVTEELPSSDQEAVHLTHVASRPTQGRASRPTQVASHPTQVAPRSNHRAPRSNHRAPRSNHRAPHSNQDARQSRQEASRLPQPTNWEAHQVLGLLSWFPHIPVILCIPLPLVMNILGVLFMKVNVNVVAYVTTVILGPMIQILASGRGTDYETTREASDLENETGSGESPYPVWSSITPTSTNCQHLPFSVASVLMVLPVTMWSVPFGIKSTNGPSHRDLVLPYDGKKYQWSFPS
ncbi:uncharacterized protein EDB91DRAFT_1082840 [Suillus paluster]|uniref:uncharacterized protein n=1 Tax=Suillus paluster TaxID=48578 RepID=UPI001B87C645|nr:uncharacterized protein EDB91DRAFT_1082840 [Suillus paluster]KAG1738080.1 hypothetical protein EDB91DRAFT_1082840 [Suillus paluster]